jgi:hypothetical protein
LGLALNLFPFRFSVRSKEGKTMKYHYAVTGLQESDGINVLSLPQPAAVGHIIQPDDTPRRYRVYWCEDPMPTELDAAFAAVNDRVTLRLELRKW